MAELTNGSTQATVYHTNQMPLMSYAIVEFKDHKSASKVRRQFLSTPLMVDSIPVKVDWSIPDVRPLDHYIASLDGEHKKVTMKRDYLINHSVLYNIH